MEIKKIVIVEETAVAKGIRRIIALSGEDAHRVQITALDFQKKLNALEKLDGSVLETALKRISQELDALYISSVTKERFRKTFNEIKKRFDDHAKAEKAQQAKIAVELVKERIEAMGNDLFFVDVMKVGSNSKALGTALNHAKAAEKAALLLSVDEESGKVLHQCVVPKTLTGQLSAIEWATVVNEIVKGKTGGKDQSAQGVGTEVDKVDIALEAARSFAKLRLA